MVSVLLLTAGYAYYQASLNNAEKLELEDGLTLEGKEYVELLPIEAAHLKMSLSTVSFFKGDFKKAAPLLEKRVDEIKKANPWLSGFLAPPEGGGEIKLWFSGPESVHFQDAPRSFQCFAPGFIPLTQLTPFSAYDKICDCYNVKIPTMNNLICKNVPLWKVSVIPDAAEPDEKFIVIESMCSILGDCHTFYALQNQLNSSNPIRSLNPIRKVEFQNEAEAYLGQEEFQYIMKKMNGKGNQQQGAKKV